MPRKEKKGLDETKELGASTAKQGIIYLAGELITSLMVLVLLIVLARVLQPIAFGLYSIVIAFETIIGIGSNFGIGTAFRKMLAEVGPRDQKRINSMLTNGYVVSLSVGLVIALAGVAASAYIANSIYHNPTLTLPLQIASVAEFFAVLFNLNVAALTGIGKVVEATWSNVVYSLVYLFGSAALVLAGFGVTGAIEGMALALLLGSLAGLWYLWVCRVRVAKLDKGEMDKLTRFSIPVVVSYIAGQGASNFSVAYLGIYAAAAAVGNYGIAYRLGRFVEITLTATGFILLPAFSKAFSKGNVSKRVGEVYNYSIYYTILFLLPMIAYGISVSAPLFRLLFSSTYVSAPFYFSVIIAGMAISIIGSYAGNLIVGKGDTKKFMVYQLIITVVQLALLIIFTPLFLVNGVLVALWLISPVVMDVIYIAALEAQFKFKHAFDLLLGPTLASIVMCVVLYFVGVALGERLVVLIVDAMLGLLIYPPLVALFKGIKGSDLEMIEEIGGRMKPIKFAFDAFVGYTRYFIRE